MTTDQQHTKRPRGRPPAVPEDRAEPVPMRLAQADRETWRALGGVEWLRPILARERKRMQRREG